MGCRYGGNTEYCSQQSDDLLSAAQHCYPDQFRTDRRDVDYTEQQVIHYKLIVDPKPDHTDAAKHFRAKP